MLGHAVQTPNLPVVWHKVTTKNKWTLWQNIVKEATGFAKLSGPTENHLIITTPINHTDKSQIKNSCFIYTVNPH